MPKVAIKPINSALITQPTATLKPAPLMAENIWPAMIHPMIPQPICMIKFRMQASFEGQ
jgi:hypothetical protein